MASLFHYIRKVRPDLSLDSFSDFLRSRDLLGKRPGFADLDTVEYWSHYVTTWFGRPNVSFESLLTEYCTVVDRLATYLELPPPAKLRGVVRQGQGGETGCRSVAAFETDCTRLIRSMWTAFSSAPSTSERGARALIVSCFPSRSRPSSMHERQKQCTVSDTMGMTADLACSRTFLFTFEGLAFVDRGCRCNAWAM